MQKGGFAFRESQLCGVQKDGVLRLAQGRGSPVGIVPVPLLNVLQHDFKGLRSAPLLQLQHPPLGPGLRGGGQEDLHIGVRQHHSTDVPAIHDYAVGAGQLLLHLQQKGPDSGMSGHGGGVHGDLGQANLLGHIPAIQQHVLEAILPIGQLHMDLRQPGGHRRLVLWINVLCIDIVSDGAVNGAGVHI